MDEVRTRQELIDARLRLAGWNLQDPSQVVEELDVAVGAASEVAESASSYEGHQFADYALLLHGRPLAIVEAKRASKDAEIGREQALQYAQHLQKKHGGALPFVFYSNGHNTHFWESGFYAPAKVHGFPTRDDLEWMDQRRAARSPLAVELINPTIAGRDYQIAAIRAILEGIEARRRRFLLVMATGTGKTRTAAALIDVLLRARWAKRVLFLVDRIALRDQALDAFEDHIPHEPRWPQNKANPEPFSRSRRLYVTTYPAMLNLIENATTPETYLSPFFFDLVIADESHRSIYDVYQQVLAYFHAIKLGLTATPTDRIDHDTFKLFDCEVSDPTFAYSYKEAISHDPPYLCDFEVLKVRSKFQLEGIQGGTLPLDVQKRLLAEGKDPEDIDFEGTDLERKVTNSGTNALIVRQFMEESIKDPNGTLPGKSIVFAISKAHARRLEELFDKLYPEHAGKLARVIVSDDPRVYGPGGLFSQFKTQDMPRVAISVDMLDTGVDIREVVNLVFAKPVWSYTKFWQMIGRGTRLLEPSDIKSWCTEKDKFLIIDCWGNFDFFQMEPRGREPSPQIPLPVRLFRARLDQLGAAQGAGDVALAEQVKADLRADLADLPANNVLVSENHAALFEVRQANFWAHIGAKEMALLCGAIAPVLRARSTADFKVMRFTLDRVEASTALLEKNPDAFEAARESLLEQISELPLTVNLVAQEKALIQDSLVGHWWQEPLQPKLRLLDQRLAPLMRFRQQRSEPLVQLDLEDLLVVKETIEFGPGHERITTKAYRERAEALVRELAERNPVLRKIQAGEPVSAAEVQSLADTLASQDPYVTENHLRRAYDHRKASFLRLIRHILGLERLESWSVEVHGAFDVFIAQHSTLTTTQIHFLQTLRTFILQTGKVERRDLVAAPFTQIHPEGIRGVFRPEEIEEILAFSERLVA